MQTAAVRDKLLSEPKRNGGGAPAEKRNGERLTYMTGDKLKEAAGYLKAARTAIFNWTREVSASTERMETDAEHLHEALGIAIELEKKIAVLKMKAHLYGATGME